ncbi:MAG: TraB/GumN family protein, partial [Methylotenera sp.]
MLASFKNNLWRFASLFLLAVASLNVSAAPGLFWKAEAPDKNPIYLFGTIHTDDNRVTEFSPAVINALKSIDVFMLETKDAQDTKYLNLANGSLKD